MEENGFVNAVEILSDSVKGLSSRRIESLWKDYMEGLSKIKSDTQFGSVACRVNPIRGVWVGLWVGQTSKDRGSVY